VQQLLSASLGAASAAVKTHARKVYACKEHNCGTKIRSFGCQNVTSGGSDNVAAKRAYKDTFNDVYFAEKIRALF
jgi:hypothetical protein